MTEDGRQVRERSSASVKPLWLRFLPLSVLAAGFFLIFFVFDAGQYLSFEALRDNRAWLQAQVAESGTATVLVYMLVYAAVVAFSIPGATVLTLLGGFLFGTWWGGSYTVVAATLGSLAVYWAARTALYDFFHQKSGAALRRMEEGFRENALSYLLVLRLVPIFPFWLVNIVPGLLGVSMRTYLAATALGIIPGTFVYASVGSGLGAIFDRGEIPDLSIVFAPEVLLPLLALALLSLVPVLYKKYKARSAG